MYGSIRSVELNCSPIFQRFYSPTRVLELQRMWYINLATSFIFINDKTLNREAKKYSELLLSYRRSFLNRV